MAKRDYTRYSNSSQPAIEERQNDEIQHIAPKLVKQEESVKEAAEIIESEPMKAKVQFGVVTNCDILNVREKPSRNANILCMIPRDSEVEISDEVGAFYKVTTTAGIEGFCMTDYIDVRK